MDNGKNKLHQAFDEDVRVERERERERGGHMIKGHEITNTDITVVINIGIGLPSPTYHPGHPLSLMMYIGGPV